MKKKRQKQAKKKSLKIEKAGKLKLLLLALVFQVVFLSPNALVSHAADEELVQSEDNVSTTLTHEHSSENCYERRWIPCGGTWRSNTIYDGSDNQPPVYYCTNNQSDRVVNGVVLSSIHPGYVHSYHSGVHSGEYATARICDGGNVGTITISRESTEEGVFLQIEIEAEEEFVSECVLRQNGEEVTLSENSCRIRLTENGRNDFCLSWYDVQSECSKETSLSYTELSIPIKVSLESEGEILDEFEIAYGGALPGIQPPEKEGYIFRGFYNGETQIYDENGTPVSGADTRWLQSEIGLEAMWEAKEYTVYYGEDADGDGVKDGVLQVIYGEEYVAVEVPSAGSGERFCGFYFGEERVFDQNGNPTGPWRWDAEGDLELVAKFEAVHSPSSENSDSEEAPSQQPASGAENISLQEEEEESLSEEGAISVNLVPSGEEDSESGGNGAPSQGDTGNTANSGDNNTANGTNETEDREKINLELINEEGGGTGAMIGDATREEAFPENESAQENVTVLNPHYNAAGRAAETAEIVKSSAVQTVLIPLSIGVSVIVLFLALYWGYLQRRVQCYAIKDGKKQNLLGNLFWRRENGIYAVYVPEEVFEKTENGWLWFSMADFFADKQKNKDIMIHLPKETITEIVRKEIKIRGL